MKFTTRDLTTIAVFGALWGIVEITLGTVLKSLNLPLSGAVLAAMGLMIAMIGRMFVPKRGATLFTGVVAMLMKLFSLGGVVLGPMIGIFAEALIGEFLLSLTRFPKPFTYFLTGSLGVSWTLVQPFVTGLLVFGRDPFVVWLDMLDNGRRLIGLKTGAVVWIVMTLIAVHVAIGAISAWLAWKIGLQARDRLEMGPNPNLNISDD